MSDFEINVHGKWILAGEHAVMRDSPAIVFPMKNRQLTLQYQASNRLHSEFSGVQSEGVHMLFWGIIERAFAILKLEQHQMTGNFHIHNEIPLGAGLGASAALCVAVTRWLIAKQWLETDALFRFARELENLFHIQSSGVDIVAVSNNEPLFYHRESSSNFFHPHWQPTWYLSYTDQIALTSNCVKKVKDLAQQNPELARRIDQDMEDCVRCCYRALTSPKEEGLGLLSLAINRAHVCFMQWGLTGGKVERHISQLLEAGALAAKPTGAGDGGFVLSLWNEPPIKNLPFELIAV